MATITPTIFREGDGSVITYLFETMTNGDDGAPIRLPAFADKSVQILGTFDTTTIVIEGSNKPTAAVDADWTTLTDPQGNALSKSAAALEQVSENPLLLRPHVTAGGGSTDLDVYITVRRPTDLRQ